MQKQPDPVLSKHAVEQAAERGVPITWIQATIAAPDQISEDKDGHLVYQSLFEVDSKKMLLRLMINPTVRPPLIKTLYLTSKIAKYWTAS